MPAPRLRRPLHGDGRSLDDLLEGKGGRMFRCTAFSSSPPLSPLTPPPPGGQGGAFVRRLLGDCNRALDLQ